MLPVILDPVALVENAQKWKMIRESKMSSKLDQILDGDDVEDVVGEVSSLGKAFDSAATDFAFALQDIIGEVKGTPQEQAWKDYQHEMVQLEKKRKQLVKGLK